MNRLADATSPYLLQHADQPVDWYPWGEEALARARAEGKPILLSIGYSACHWCHVMAHESFADAAIAARMNRLFVNIKVDREERPDLDRIYQVAHQLLTRSGGGWPLTMFLAPDDQLPFFGGTYFPNQPRHGRPGFGEVLERVAAAWQEQRRHMTEFGASMREALAAALGGGADDAGFEPALTARAVQKLVQSFDARLGGFGGAPKFPHPPALALLALDYPQRTDFTLRAMAAGGLVDQLGGGFYRYSTDAHWSIPHFEKMLYDNAALLALYAEAGSARDAADLRAVACDTADWLLAEMRAPEGGFHSSIDADSDGGEGAFYVWTRDEVVAVLGTDHAAFAAEFGLDQAPNFEDRWHLRRAAPRGDAPLAPLSPDLRAARRRLYAARATRPRPATDDKILTAWNALAIEALARAGRLLGRADCVAAASEALDFLVRVHWRDGRLLATSRHGVARLPAYLDDHAFLLAATLELLACRWRRADFDFALALAERLLADFADAERGGFYFTAVDHERLLVRVRTFSDDALPAGNAVAAAALAELAFLTGEPRYQQAADRTLAAAQAAAREFPEGHASVLLAAHARASARHVVLRVADGADGTEVTQWRSAADVARVRCYALPADEPGLPVLLASRAALPGAALTAWVCRGTSCQAPATTRAAFARALAG